MARPGLGPQPPLQPRHRHACTLHRHPDRVQSLALMCPSGIGKQKVTVMFKAIVLSLLGRWGRRRASALILGELKTTEGASVGPTPEVRAFARFMRLIQAHFKARRVRLPIFGDDALGGLKMPMLTIVGTKDALLDSEETRARLQRHVPQASVRFLPDTGHLITGQTEVIHQFLCTELSPGVSA